MKVSNFKYTLFTKNLHSTPKVVKYGNIQSSYKTQAYRHTLEYNDDLLRYLAKHDNRIAGFMGIAHARTLYIDLDQKSNSLDHLSRQLWVTLHSWAERYDLTLDAINVFFSGKKGFHIHIPTRLFGLKPQKRLPDMLKKFVGQLFEGTPAEYAVDLSIYNYNQWIRLPNSIHAEQNQYKVPISVNDLWTMSGKEIRLRSRSQILDFPQIKSSEFSRNSRLSQAWNDIISATLPGSMPDASGAEEGFRHTSMLPLIRKCWWRHYTEDETFHYLDKWDKSHNTPPMSEPGQLRSTISNWFHRAERRGYKPAGDREGLFDVLTSILAHPELTMLEKGLLTHIFHHSNRMDKNWQKYRVKAGSMISTRVEMAALMSITVDQFDGVRKKLRNLGLLYSLKLPSDNAIYFTLGPLLRDLKLGKIEPDISIQLPPTSEPANRWEARPRYNESSSPKRD